MDRGALTHNSTEDIRRALSMVKNALSKDGHFISLDWFSVKRKEFRQKDAKIIDDFTRSDFASGYFCGLGKVHFTDKEHFLDLMQDFHPVYLAEKTNESFYPEEELDASWDFVGSKK